MEIWLLMVLLTSAVYVFQARDERRRIALLSGYLGQYQIEQHMASLTTGYMRALGESNPERQQQIWTLLGAAESALCEQFGRLVADLARLDGAAAQVSKWPLSIFYTRHLFPTASFDLRKVLAIHARGICQAVANGLQHSARDRAFLLLAEVLLMQHTCHWYCKSRSVASARLILRHQTPYAKVLESVSPQTRQAYGALVSR